MASIHNDPTRVLVTGGSGFIGTNLVEELLTRGISVLNLDIQPPKNTAHGNLYTHCDILDRPALGAVLKDFQPTSVVHLAARTDLIEEEGLEAYAANIAGVENVLAAVRATRSINRVVFTSTKLVNRNGEVPEIVTEYTPNTLYGRSKSIGEQIVRENPPECDWMITRPTSIWGPWFEIPYKRFFLAVANRSYFHMLGCDLPKRFGFVGNTVKQIMDLLSAPRPQVLGQTFYLADYYVTTIRTWADEIARQIRGRKNMSAPNWAVELGARLGDIAKACGVKDPPLSSFRLRNMRTPTADVPLENMLQVTRELPYTEENGVRLTIQWMKDQGVL